MPPALFVVGTSRSGTSWVFDLCASHPDMSMGYESKLPIEGIEIHRRWAERLGDRTADHAAMAELLSNVRDGIDDPSNTELLRLLDRPDVVDRAVAANEDRPGWASICEAVFCSLEGTTNWGNKMLRIELVPTVLEHWPDARFLVLSRDPRGVVASQATRFEHSLEYSAVYWNTHTRWIMDHVGDDPRYCVVDLVDLARAPEPTLEWAFDAVGLSTEPVAELVERFPGAPERPDAWRHTLGEDRQRRIEEYCYDAMVAFGYRPELAAGPRRISTARRALTLARQHGGEVLRDPASIRRKQVGRRLRAALGR